MDKPLIQILIIGLFVGVIFITSFFPSAKKISDRPPLPKTIHKIIAIIFCALVLSLGFFLGKYSSSNDLSDKPLESKGEKVDKPSVDKKADNEVKKSSLTLDEYLQKVRSYIDKEDYKSAAYRISDTTGVSPENPPNDLHSLPGGSKIEIGDQNLSKAYLLRAFAFRKLGEWSLSIANYIAAMNLAKLEDHIYFKQHIASVHKESGNYMAALADYKAVIKGVKDSPHQYVDIVNVYYGMGLAFEKEGAIQEALDAYQNAQKSAYDYAPCKCYEHEDKIMDPLKCMFIGFDTFHTPNFEEIQVDQAFLKECESEIAMPEKPGLEPIPKKPGGIDRPKTKKGETLKPSERWKIEKDRIIAKNKEKELRYDMALKQREIDIEKCKARKKQQINTAPTQRIFASDSPLAYSYFRRGRLYLKNSMHKDSTIHDFMNLVKLCGLNQNGACTELIELLGEKKYQDLRSLINSQKEDSAIALLSNTLKKVTVEEEEEAVLSLKGWKLWGLIGVLVIVAFSLFVYITWRNRNAKKISA